MNYLVIDLEMCRVPRDYRSKRYKYASETMQIGAVLLDEEFKRIGTLSQFVHPEYGVIDYFIENLTGIKNGQVKHAPRLQEALLHMLNWIGDREYKVYAWSGSDRAQILHEMKAKNIVDEKIVSFMEESRWVDYQDIFMKRYEMSKKMSLEEALGRADIDPHAFWFSAFLKENAPIMENFFRWVMVPASAPALHAVFGSLTSLKPPLV